MSNSKNYNSIFFLTTLSVYLGLVLVGGSVPVMAQAALTQRFEILHEIEAEDDLDKNPDDEHPDFDGPLERYLANLKEVVADLHELQQIEKFAAAFEAWAFRHDADQKRADKRWLEPGSAAEGFDFQAWDFLGAYSADESVESRTLTGIDFAFDKVKFETVFPAFKTFPSRAAYLAENFTRPPDVFAPKEDPSPNAIFKNNFLQTENNQVFIVTRLPRASIDSFLA